MQTKSGLLSIKNGFILLVILLGVSYFIFQKLRGEKREKTVPSAVDQSIAVLPFVNMSNDSNETYFSDGLSEEILNSLSQVRSLKVSARASSFKFRNNNTDVRDIGNKLGVRTLLKGSYQLEGDRIKITTQLINVENGSDFWSEQYNEDLDNIFSLQNKIVNTVEEKLDIIKDDNDQANLSKRTIANTGAYKLYLKGRQLWNLRTPPDLKNGIDFFKQAIAIDTSYAAAYAGIADCYTALGYGSFLSPKEAFPKAFEAATKALQIDSTLAEPHATLGYYQFYYEWDWAAAEQEFRSAIALNPNYALGYDWYGYYLTAMKRYDEANVVLKKTFELDPLSAPIVTDIGFSYYYRGDYDAAIKNLEQSLKINPKLGLAYLWLGRSYQAKKLYPEAINAYENGLKITPGWPVAFAQIGNVYGVSGNKAAAQNILDTLTSLSSKKYVTSYGVALVYVGLGKNDLAFEWLNKAYNERTHWLVWLRSDPRWIPLKSDKRYTELVNKVGLPQ